MEAGHLVDQRFRIVAIAGKGGMGTVYRAVDEKDQSSVALKVLAHLADEARFQAEVDALRRATHPNIVTYVAHGISAGQTFVVMEWLEGADLEHVLESGVPMKSNAAAMMGATLAEALSFLHAREIVHRDVKPGNIFLRTGDPALPKLLDLGIARRLDQPSRITHKGAIVGTPSYMAPEAALGHDGVDGRADVFSLGCVLYEAVTARSPFEGDNAVHVLAKILVDDPVRPSRFAPDLDPRMEEAILAMLAKDVSRRPTAGEARLMLERVGEPESRLDAPLTMGERRVVSVLLTSSPSVTADTIHERDALVADAHVRAAVARHRGTLLSLPHSAILATFGGPGAPSDHAVRAADCALDLAGWIGTAHTAIVTARPEAREGSLADRASQLLKQAKRSRVPSILIDPASEPLLGSRFVLEETPIGLVLRSAKRGLAGARTLLGKATRCVGRDVELAMLIALVRESAQDRVARSAIVIGDPGMGKTRLLYEVVSQARLVHFLTARGESTTAFSVAGQLVRRAAGIEHGSSAFEASARLDAHVAARVGGPFASFARELLGEIAQVQVAEPSAALLTARSDPAIFGDSIRRAFVAWLAAETARAPLGVVIEDIHWADAPSLGLLAAAVRALGDQPLFLLLSSRPGARQAQDLAAEIEAREVRLGKLSRASSERYVRDLVPDVPEATVDFIVARSGGHPFYLEDLVRALLEGLPESSLADTALGMLEARFDSLEPTVRRALRAASTFGPVFRADAAEAVLGDSISPALRVLVQAELVEALDPPGARFHRFRFRHALIRDAAYAGLTEADRKTAHRRAARWLRDSGEGDPAIIAGHFAESGDIEDAAPYYQKSAELAFEGNDSVLALDLACRALEGARDETMRGSLELLAGEACFWMGRTAAASQYAAQAITRLRSGTAAWFNAVSLSAGAGGQLGDNDSVRKWLDVALGTQADAPSARAQLLCVGRAVSQLLWGHQGFRIESQFSRFHALAKASEPLSPLLAGWVHRVHGEREMVLGRFGETFREFALAIEAYLEAGAIRLAAFLRFTLGALRAAAGDHQGALVELADGKVIAASVGAALVHAYGRLTHGIVFALSGRPSEADVELRAALVGLAGNARLSFVTYLFLSLVREQERDLLGALDAARAATEQPVGPYLRQSALGQCAHLLVRLGRFGDAEALALAVDEDAPELVECDLFAGLVGYGKAEVLFAMGRGEAARAVLGRVVAALRGWAVLLPPELEAPYLARSFPNREVLELANAWGIEHPVVTPQER